jgi:hypothetical protein
LDRRRRLVRPKLSRTIGSIRATPLVSTAMIAKVMIAGIMAGRWRKTRSPVVMAGFAQLSSGGPLL